MLMQDAKALFGVSENFIWASFAMEMTDVYLENSKFIYSLSPVLNAIQFSC